MFRAPGFLLFPLLHETHAARFAHFGLDTVLGFELVKEFGRGELGRQYVGLPFHRRESTVSPSAPADGPCTCVETANSPR